MGLGTFITNNNINCSIQEIASNDFFPILSTEWKKLITPVWNNHAINSKIIGLFLDDTLIGGGILFNKTPPYATCFEKDHDFLFERGYIYLGYVWIQEQHRNKGYASSFLTLLKKANPHLKIWLTIEEENLRYFYEQNGFKLFAESKEIDITKEWILTYG